MSEVVTDLNGGLSGLKAEAEVWTANSHSWSDGFSSLHLVVQMSDWYRVWFEIYEALSDSGRPADSKHAIR